MIDQYRVAEESDSPATSNDLDLRFEIKVGLTKLPVAHQARVDLDDIV
jgi:hypothetical protein